MTEELPTPASRKESYLAKAAGMAVTIPDKPESRLEQYLNAIANGGGGGGGSYTAGNGINIANNTISVDTTTIQPKLTAGTNITISDNVISASGGSITPVQTTGTSTTDVMSQDATTKMVFDTASGTIGQKVKIGYNASTVGTESTSIGSRASVSAAGAGGVAIGAGSSVTAQTGVAFAYGQATTQGEFNVGTGYDWSSGGYNNTAYRLITGVHDPVNAHDAATKGYVDANAGGGIKTLTTDDYNYPTTGTKTQIALWLLDDGYYIIPSDIKSSMLGCLDGFVPGVSNASSAFNNYLTTGNIYTFAKFVNKFWFYSNTGNAFGMCIGGRPIMYGTISSSGYLSMSISYRVLCGNDIKNNLTTTTIGYALDATQGKELKDLITGTTESYTIASGSWTALSASSPYTYSTTVTATYTIGNDTIAELINDNAVAFSNYGFSIGSISGQNVTIYSIGQPSASVTLKVNYKG